MMRTAALILLSMSSAPLAWSQTPPLEDRQKQASEEQQPDRDRTSAADADTANAADADGQRELRTAEGTALPLISPAQREKERAGYEQTKRMFWIIPNFAAVSADTEVPPLSRRAKFDLAMHDSIDYSGFTWTAILAGQGLGLRTNPELGSGMKGYGRYYWRLLLDNVSGTFFTEAIVPIMTHEDPRYYTLGHGGFFRRMGYALSRTVVTRKDSEGTSFNWSDVVGNALEAALSNAYYPAEDRGFKQTARDWGQQMESAVINNIAMEFWPDIRHGMRRLILRHD